jgi:hypothetical protein
MRAGEEAMDRLQSIAGGMYAVGSAGFLEASTRLWFTAGKMGMIGHILPHNLLQLCVVAFLIAIASDARLVASTRER